MEIQNCLKGRYKVIQNIGKGGMGSVYKVKGIEDGNYYAAKIIYHNDICSGEKEAQILLGLHHHMLPEIKEYFVFDKITVIVMDFINGCNMEEYIKKKGPVSNSKAVFFLRQMSDILMYLHDQRPPVIYRDLKPSNIMVDVHEDLRLIDFGTARGYRMESDNDTVALGTPGYAAPEQLMGTAQSDIRTDIYSLGATMYYIVTGIDVGKPPFELPLVNSVRTGIEPWLEQIIKRCLQKNPDSRYQSVNELLSELDYGEFQPYNIKYKNFNPINIVITHSNRNISL
ncbi:MAG: serine/threonine protein kinase [Lachnospiraceae bacterium]